MSETLTPPPPAAGEGPRASTGLPSQYAPAEVEGALYDRWVERGYFTADPASDRPPFAIVIPPPNVTGSLHLGHAFEHTLIDALIRRRRMQGYDALWLPGTDHAGIATQNVVERELRKDGVSRHDLGREAFVAKVWEWKEESGGKILGQMRRLGRRRRLVARALHDGRGPLARRPDDLQAPVRRRPDLPRRAHHQLVPAVPHRAVGHRGRAPRGRGRARRARVRRPARATTASSWPPPGSRRCSATPRVAVHPEDERYRHLVGREIELPLIGRRIPVVADDHVDPAFGTGAVKVTPAHDPNDFEIGRRHGLPSVERDDARGASSPAPARRSTAWTASRPAPPSARRCASRAGSVRRSGRTCTPSATARAARPSSSRGSACSGSSTSARWPRRRATPSATAG